MRHLPAGWALGFMFFGIASALTFGSARILTFILSVGFLLAGLALDFFRTDLRYAMPREVSQQNPFIWLTLTYLVVVGQGVWINGLDVDSVLRSLSGGVLILGATLASHRGLAIHPTLLRMGLLGYLAAGVIVGFAGSATSPCRSDKCSPVGVLYKGGFTHENMMGWAAVLSAIVLLGSVVRRRDRRFLLLALASLSLGLAVLSGARTSLYAGVATAVAFGGVMLFRRWRTAVAATVPILCSGVGLYLIHRAQVEDFSTRGRRWVVIRDSLDGVTSVFGHGLTAWVDLQPQFAIPTSTHSVYGAILIQGGLLALVPFTMFLVVATRRAQQSGALEVVVLLHFVAFQAIMETVWEPSVLVQRGWVLVALAMTIPAGYSPARGRRIQPPEHRSYVDVRHHPYRSPQSVDVTRETRVSHEVALRQQHTEQLQLGLTAPARHREPARHRGLSA